MFDLLANKELKGEWLEYPKDLLAEAAVLGIRESKDVNEKIKRTVEEFIPGMILTINRDKSKNEKPIFKRLFAPGFSHTIRKQTRSCESCHNNSAALGYGRGKLEYKITDGVGTWFFTPKYPQLKMINFRKMHGLVFLESLESVVIIRPLAIRHALSHLANKEKF